MAINPVSISNKTLSLLKLRQVTDQEQATFAAILEKTRELPPQQAKQTLSTLKREELDLLEKVHYGTAVNAFSDSPAQIDGLSDEAASNLLLQPSEYVDRNHDGITEVGKGKLLIFPPTDAPPSVQAAWEKATAKMDPGQKLTYALRMHISIYGVITDDTPRKEAPRTVEGYAEILKFQLKVLEENRNQLSPAVYRQDKEFLTRFLSALLDPQASLPVEA